MSHYSEIHATLHKALMDAAIDWTPEAIQEALVAGRKRQRAEAMPTFCFDRSKHGVAARVEQVRASWPNGLCE